MVMFFQGVRVSSFSMCLAHTGVHDEFEFLNDPLISTFSTFEGSFAFFFKEGQTGRGLL